MGINIPTREELVANEISVKQLEKRLGVTSLAYLSVDGLKEAIERGISTKEVQNIGHCFACFTGKYPVPVKGEICCNKLLPEQLF